MKKYCCIIICVCFILVTFFGLGSVIFADGAMEATIISKENIRGNYYDF